MKGADYELEDEMKGEHYELVVLHISNSGKIMLDSETVGISKERKELLSQFLNNCPREELLFALESNSKMDYNLPDFVTEILKSSNGGPHYQLRSK